MEYIKALSPDFQIKDGLESLGKWQASRIITQIKEKQDDLKYDIAKHKKGGTLKKLLWLIIVIVIIYYFAKSGL